MAAYWCKFFNFLHSTKSKQFKRYYVNGWSKQQFLYPVVGIIREADSGVELVYSVAEQRKSNTWLFLFIANWIRFRLEFGWN